MRVIDVLNAPWAIQPEKLEEIREIYLTHLRGDKIDIASVEAQLGRPLNNDRKPYQVLDGVAVLSMDGVLSKKMNLFTEISGGCSMQIMQKDLNQALHDRDVGSIILCIDSPGGTVDGTQNLADDVAGGQDIKPIVAFADGLMASAAYWIGSAAAEILISDATTQVGSIGVVSTHVDVSKQDERYGIKRTEIYAGKYKRIASSYAPLTESGRATIQEQVDYLYSLFVGAVAKQRGVAEGEVLERMADGRIFIGQQAIDAGLVDGVSTLGALIAKMAGGYTPPRRQSVVVGVTAAPAVEAPSLSAGVVLETQTTEKEIHMDLATLERDHPALAVTLREQGAVAERTRIQSVESQLMPGHEKLINTLKFDGKTTGEQAAVQVLQAERASGASRLAAITADGQQASVAALPVETAPAKAAAEDKSLPIEQRCKAKWDSDAALQAEFGGQFNAYVAFEKAKATGSVKILGKAA